MYGNNSIEKELIVNDDPIKLAEFEARIASGDKIEPKDWNFLIDLILKLLPQEQQVRE